MSSAKATAAAPSYSEGEQAPLSLDLAGNLRVIGSGGGGAIVVIGNDTPSDAFVNPTDFVGAWSLQGGFNGATWDRIRTVTTNAAGIALNVIGAQLGVNCNQIYSPAGASWIPQYGIQPADAIATPGIATNAAGFTLLWNGTNWNRARCDGSFNLRNIASPPNVADANETSFSALAAGTSGMVGVISAVRAKLLGFDARALVALGGWFQLHNKATAPVLADVPVMSFKVKLNTDSEIIIPRGFFGETGRLFTTGISWGFSSTASTFTVAADSPYSVNASYVA